MWRSSRKDVLVELILCREKVTLLVSLNFSDCLNISEQQQVGGGRF